MVKTSRGPNVTLIDDVIIIRVRFMSRCFGWRLHRKARGGPHLMSRVLPDEDIKEMLLLNLVFG